MKKFNEMKLSILFINRYTIDFMIYIKYFMLIIIYLYI